MQPSKIYDLIGIGIGPFNLGLAALAHSIPSLRCLFIDSKEQFNWHPGMLIPGTRMQVPFYADLVTLVDPCSPFNYFKFLQAKERMLSFGILENNYPLRSEYNEYCQWVAGQLPNLAFGNTCQSIHYLKKKKCYKIVVSSKYANKTPLLSKHIVIGVGTAPCKPPCSEDINHPMVFHSNEYLFKKMALLMNKNITLIGSGQSAAEIFRDLLEHSDQIESLSWFTRSERLFPMDFSKFALEMASPVYMKHFYELLPENKIKLLQGQQNLFKGINMDLIADIYERLSFLRQSAPGSKIKIAPCCTLQHISLVDDMTLGLQLCHHGYNKTFSHETQAVILATGYDYQVPSFLDPLKERIQWLTEKQYAVNLNYSIDNNNTLFVQNADLHTHGFNSADLGMGPHRNAVILNSIMGYQLFKTEMNTAFQCFDPFN